MAESQAKRADRPDPALDELIHAVIDGDASAQQVAELNERVKAEPGVAGRLIELSELHVLSGWLFSGAEQGEAEPTCRTEEGLLNEILEQAIENRRLTLLSDQAERALAQQQAGERQLEKRDETESASGPRVLVIPKLVVWGGLAAAVLAVVGLIMVGVRPDPNPGLTQSDPSQSPASSVDAPMPAPAQAVAKLVGERNAAWSPAGLEPSGNGDLAAGRYELLTGAVELSMGRGAAVVVQSPCVFDLVDDNRAKLVRGSVVARVPKRATGFTIESGRIRVVDLGTEFGVAVDESGAITTTVFVGEVVMGSADNAVTSMPLKVGQTARAHASGRIEPAQATISLLDRTRFSRTLDAAAATPAERYAQQVLAARPLVYWRFEDGPTGSANLAGNRGWDAEPVGEVKFAAGLFGRAPEFTGQIENMTAFRSASFIEFGIVDAFTFEAWCYIESQHHGRIVELVDNHTDELGRMASMLAVETIGDTHAGVAAPVHALRMAHRNPPSASVWAGRNAFGQTDYPVGRWVHIVTMKDGGRIKLYLDGELHGEQTDQQRVADNLPLTMYIGAASQISFTDRDLSPTDYRPFHGRIDEVAFYNRALTEAEIREHHFLGQTQDDAAP